MSEYIKQNEFTYFTVITHNPSGGAVTNADETPKYRVYNKTTGARLIDWSVLESQTNVILGNYWGSFYTSGNLFSVGDYCSVIVSGKVASTVDFVEVKSFQVAPTINANITQTSGTNISPFFGQDSYFANIKFIKDNINSRDEYNVNWFKNSTPLGYGLVTNPALTVYNTSTGAALFSNQVLTAAGSPIGALRFNGSSNILPSGEVYLAVTSGLIDGSVRRWENLVGIDSL